MNASKIALLGALAAALLACGQSWAAPYPMVREKPTFYEMLFDFKDQHRAWWAELPEEKKRPIRQTWWRDATKNNFHDIVEVSHPESFLAVATDDGGKSSNFGEFFPWFYADNAEEYERMLLSSRVQSMRSELPEGDPLRDLLPALLDDLPSGESGSRERMAVYFNLVEYDRMMDRLETLDYVKQVVRDSWATPLRDEIHRSKLPERVKALERSVQDRRREAMAAVANPRPPAPPNEALNAEFAEVESLAAAYRIRAAGVDQLLFAQRTPARGTHWYESFGYWCDRYSEDLKDWNVQYSGRLIGFDLATLEETTIFEDPEGGIRDPFVSYDGQKILFAYRPGGEFHNHLYEINVDGTNLTQLTDGPDDDIEPIYLPNGDIVFCSSRARRWVPCLNAQVATIHRAEPDGSDIRMLTSNVETENTPWVMPDGRLLFMRWEYVERDRGFPHGLWTVNPDGTGIMTFWGNMNEPDVFIDAKPIPDTNEVLFIRHPHGSGEHIGTVSVLNPDNGPDEKASVRNVTPYIRLDQKKGYRDPWPIAKGVYLACQEDRLYLLDDDGRRLLLHRVPEGWVHEPRELRARPKPPVIPDRIDRTKDTGTLILADVTQGRRLENVEYNEVDHLLLLEVLPKPVHHTGHTENLSYNGNFFLERVLGTVPVEEDGSAFFEAPALGNLFMVAMDEDGNSIKRMQSFVTLQPGEISSCVGCHENRTETAERITNLQALERPRSIIQKPPEGVPDIFHFPRDIQPILDDNCVSCHDNDTRAGNVVLNGDLDPFFNQAYVTLRMRELIASGFGGVGGKGNLPPRTVGAGASKLYQLIRDGHQGVELSDYELAMIYYWIESWAQYSGTFAFLNKDGDIRMPINDRLLAQHCGDCHGKSKWEGFANQNGAPPTRADLRESMGIRINVSNPEASLMLTAPLAKEAGGLGLCKDRKAVSRRESLQGVKNWIDVDRGEPANAFTSKDDPIYQKMLAEIRDYAVENLAKQRMELPDPLPHHDWVREMKRNGILGADFTPEGKDLQFYFDVDEAYYRSFWHEPIDAPGTVSAVDYPSSDNP